MTQESLAERMGINPSTGKKRTKGMVSLWETNGRFPSGKNLEKMLKILEADLIVVDTKSRGSPEQEIEDCLSRHLPLRKVRAIMDLIGDSVLTNSQGEKRAAG